MADEEERLDEEAAVEKLNEALALQYRSATQYTLTSGSLFGFEFQSLGDRLWLYAQAELGDARLLVEKIVALGGTPATNVDEMKWSGDPGEAVDWLIESEGSGDRGAGGGDRADRARGPLGGAGAHARAPDHAQAEPGGFPAALPAHELGPRGGRVALAVEATAASCGAR